MLCMMKIPLLMALLGIPLFVMDSDAEAILTEHDGSKESVFKQGDRFSVHLPANPSTGYSWSLTIAPKSGGMLIRTQEPEFQSSRGSAALCGAGGVEIWKFRAAKPGKTRLTFSYARLWEKGVPAVQIIEYDLAVKSP